MKILLATGIYPPDIGGPSTYTKALAQALIDLKHEVSVITYSHHADHTDPWPVVRISKSGGPILRWWRYSRAIKKHGADADIVYAFSSVSVGVPLRMSGMRKPKKILRLGGDFLWERYTDRGGRKSLQEWYERSNWQVAIGRWLLQPFDHIVFSTVFQKEIYEKAYATHPEHSVIENALTFDGLFTQNRKPHQPFRLLFMGRFVRFKNIASLIRAIVHLPDVTLTIVGEGPLRDTLTTLTKTLALTDRVRFLPPVGGSAKGQVFQDHDLLVLPSLTEISPNVALEAKGSGLDVLITHENGLHILADRMYFAPLRSPEEITKAISQFRKKPSDTDQSPFTHSWSDVASETIALFTQLTAP